MSRTYRRKKRVKPEKSWRDPTYNKKTQRRKIERENCPSGSYYKRLAWKWDYS